jgi:hypothetical protein
MASDCAGGHAEGRSTLRVYLELLAVAGLAEERTDEPRVFALAWLVSLHDRLVIVLRFHLEKIWRSSCAVEGLGVAEHQAFAAEILDALQFGKHMLAPLADIVLQHSSKSAVCNLSFCSLKARKQAALDLKNECHNSHACEPHNKYESALRQRTPTAPPAALEEGVKKVAPAGHRRSQTAQLSNCAALRR